MTTPTGKPLPQEEAPVRKFVLMIPAKLKDASERPQRSGGLRKHREGAPVPPRRDKELPPPEKAPRVAERNAEEMEWATVRREIQELVLSSMSAAEGGVRIQSLLSRHPDLLSDQLGFGPLKLEGEGKNAYKELLPLPVPRITGM